MTITSPDQALKILLNQRPKFHGEELAGTKNYAIRPKVLEWLSQNISDNSITLETGCGYTTVVLATLAKKHTVISPFNKEHELIKNFCTSNGILFDHVEMIAKPSQEVLPEFKCDPTLDFILIDGDHAFPTPFIDWYYTADQLKVGGILAIDDTHITTGTILRDFLLREDTRWSLIKEIGTTAFFKRITKENVARDVSWEQQKYCEKAKKPLLTRIINKVKRTIKSK